MVSMIVAVDCNNGIGYQNELLFHSKEDMQHFRNITMGKTVVMGRKTAESLPKGFLPHRNNLILSSGPEKEEDIGGFFVRTTQDDIEYIVNHYDDIVVIGGGSVYEQFMPYAEKIYLTKFEYGVEHCDTYFPKIDGGFRENFIRREKLVVNVISDNTYKNILTTFFDYDRIAF